MRTDAKELLTSARASERAGPAGVEGGEEGEEEDEDEDEEEEEVSSPTHFRRTCWECKSGKFAHQHNTIRFCRERKRHTGPDWDRDWRHNMMSRKKKGFDIVDQKYEEDDEGSSRDESAEESDDDEDGGSEVSEEEEEEEEDEEEGGSEVSEEEEEEDGEVENSYEQLRRTNIERNKSVMLALGIDSDVLFRSAANLKTPRPKPQTSCGGPSAPASRSTHINEAHKKLRSRAVSAESSSGGGPGKKSYLEVLTAGLRLPPPPEAGPSDRPQSKARRLAGRGAHEAGRLESESSTSSSAAMTQQHPPASRPGLPVRGGDRSSYFFDVTAPVRPPVASTGSGTTGPAPESLRGGAGAGAGASGGGESDGSETEGDGKGRVPVLCGRGHARSIEPISAVLMRERMHLEGAALWGEEPGTLAERDARRRREGPMGHGKCYCAKCAAAVAEFLREPEDSL